MTLPALLLTACIHDPPKDPGETAARESSAPTADSSDSTVDSTIPGDDTAHTGETGPPCTVWSWHPDADGDGYGDPTVTVEACDAPEGWLADGSDCDDTDPDIHPGGTETRSDGVDSDCSGYDECGDGAVASDDPWLRTNEELVTFCETYSQVDGTLGFSGEEWETLAGLECLCAVSGNLFLSNTYALHTLDGLENLGTIGGLSITSASALESLSGMASLNVATLSKIEIDDAPVLTDISVLAGVREVTGDVTVMFAPSLTDLTPLTAALETVGGSLTATDESPVEEVPALTQIGGGLYLSSGWAIADFPVLARVGVGLWVYSGASDVEPGDFPLLNEVGGQVWLRLYYATALPQAPNLETIGGSLYIDEMHLLEELDAFGAVREIGGDLVIEDCDSLTSLSGLTALEYVGGCIDVDCPGIPAEDVDAFEAAIPYVGGVCLGEIWKP